MSFVSNIIWLTVLFCVTLKPNGKFCMGLKGIERLESSVFNEVVSQLSSNLHVFCTQVCTVFRSKKRECDSEELFERKLVVSFVLHYSRFFRK